jgi:hypothetical protein
VKHANPLLVLVAIGLIVGIGPLAILALVRRRPIREPEPPAAVWPPLGLGAWRTVDQDWVAGQTPTTRFPRHLEGDTRSRPISRPYVGSES